MDFVESLQIFNYGLALIFGVLLSTHIAGGWETPQEKRLTIALCPLLLLVQGLFWLALGTEAVRKLYPLLIHLPLLLFLVFALKKRWNVALLSVCTAYLCCQLPRWVDTFIFELTASPLAGEISYLLVIAPIYFLLRLYFASQANYAMVQARMTLVLFGSIPVGYYLAEYAALFFGNTRLNLVLILLEFLPTALIIFYLITFAAYHAQRKKQTQAELQKSMLEAELKQSITVLENLRSLEAQTAAYQHDMRHHLTAIDALLSACEMQKAQEYIRNVQTDLETFTPTHFCENELFNLLCSSFSAKAELAGVQLKVKATLPQNLSVSDTDFCSILSNGLENALHAVADLEESLKWAELYCNVRMSKLLIEIKNPHGGKITIRDDMPVSARAGHGYGCKNIRFIVEKNGGICVFDDAHGVFTLRVMLPVR